MALRPPFDREPTHRLYAGPHVTGNGAFAVENELVRRLLRFGTAVHVAAGESFLDDAAPGAATAFRSLTPVASSECRPALYAVDERVAALPADADAVLAVLGDPLDPGGADDWRAFAVDALLVRDGDDPLYHSVPHESHVRELYVDGSERLDTVRRAVESVEGVRGVACYPAEPLATWTVARTTYSLTPTTLRVTTDDDTTGYGLDRLVRVRPSRAGTSVRCEWRSRTATARDGLQRALGRLLDTVGSEPPGSVPVGDARTREGVLGVLDGVSRRLNYDLRVAR